MQLIPTAHAKSISTESISTESISIGASSRLTFDQTWIALHLVLLLMSAGIVWISSSKPVVQKGWKAAVARPFRLEQARSIATTHRFISTNAKNTQADEPGDGCSCYPSNSPSDRAIRQDLSEVWELSSRHLPEKFNCINPLDPGLKAYRHTEVGWQSDQIENVLLDDGRMVILYVHGNFMERSNARERVLILNEYLKQRATRPYKLLMLSWPSTREPHPLRDVYENAQSAESQALLVGWILEKLAMNSADVSLLGFSFGARAVSGGLHYASGGTVAGFHYQSIQAPGSTLPRYRVALVAPALDRDWLAPGGKHERALEHVSGLINLYNSRDPILRRFRFIDRLSQPVAAGFAGFIGLPGIEGFSNPRATSPLENSTKIRQFDCGSGIGTTHSERSYYAQCPYFALVLDHLLGQESNANPIH